MHSDAPIQSPTLPQEQERLRKWREVRRQAAADPKTERLRQADQDRRTRLDQFETDKSERIRNAETNRREEAQAIEARRMDKARVHLEALDDIETARATLISARQKTRFLTAALLAIFVGLPTVATAAFYLFIATPIYQSTSTLALDLAIPMSARNPLFSNVSGEQNSMAAAFQLRVKMQAQSDTTFEMAIDSSQGLLLLTTTAPTPSLARTRNTDLIKIADTLAFPGRLGVLAQPEFPSRAISRLLPNTLLTFLTSLTLFTICAIFFQSFRHYARI
jgi:hypothetical protein